MGQGERSETVSRISKRRKSSQKAKQQINGSSLRHQDVHHRAGRFQRTLWVIWQAVEIVENLIIENIL